MDFSSQLLCRGSDFKSNVICSFLSPSPTSFYPSIVSPFSYISCTRWVVLGVGFCWVGICKGVFLVVWLFYNAFVKGMVDFGFWVFCGIGFMVLILFFHLELCSRVGCGFCGNLGFWSFSFMSFTFSIFFLFLWARILEQIASNTVLSFTF